MSYLKEIELIDHQMDLTPFERWQLSTFGNVLLSLEEIKNNTYRNENPDENGDLAADKQLHDFHEAEDRWLIEQEF